MAKVKKPPPPDSLTLGLFAPGMTVLHRAGLGGLACTLRYIERGWAACAILDEDLPGAPWEGGAPPWHLDEQSVTLRFGQPELAREYLRKLFRLAFGLKDGLIYLPGQYGDLPPSLAVRAELQAGLTLTFLQHPKTRTLAREPTVFQHDPNGDGQSLVTVEYRKCERYKHQDGWEKLCDAKSGCLVRGPVEVIGPLNPGAIVRHVAFTADTKIKDEPERVLPLYFALVGCLALPVNRGVGVLLTPEVDNLLSFRCDRPAMTPSSIRECRIAGAGDAVLQALVRLRSRGIITAFRMPGCLGARFEPTSWASQQKSRVETISECPHGSRVEPATPTGDDLRLHRFEVALAELPPRVVTRTATQTTGSGRQRRAVQRTEAFWADSVVRPLVADNLATGKPWYRGFTQLMIDLDGNGQPIREKLPFEKKGLHAMTEMIPWDHEGETVIVRAVHEALRRRYGQIADENQGNPGAMKNRFKGEYDRWRLAFAGAKTADQFRGALCDLFSRGGPNKVLRQQWEAVLPVLSESKWQLGRDLALLALASYAGRDEAQDKPAAQDDSE
jgi:CRISPR-associated protein Cas8a1/Csx13